MSEGSALRDHILTKYDFTPDARALLGKVRVEVEDPTSTSGGGLWYPAERRIYLNTAQDEACVHELAHAWADLAGFYVDPHPTETSRNARHYEFRRDVERAAGEANPEFRRIAFLSWEYTHGNPRTGFKGMGEADWERFAGLASGVMGDIRLMPPYVRRWYSGLFGGSPEVDGPAGLPTWAPKGWSAGGAVASGLRAEVSPASRFSGWLRRILGN